TVNSEQIHAAISEPLEAVVGAVKEVLEATPPELSADIVNKGIIMTGGGSLLHNFDKLISKETGLPVYVAEDAISCVAKGTGKALLMINMLSTQKYKKLFYRS
ncbi:rod shape-determining protein, partial [Peptococcaceae bacterium]|nr:rod shape-determining protein [Peptococcaceae bacterium]